MEAILDARVGWSCRERLYLVKGADPMLRSRAAQTLVDELLGGEDRTLVVEEFTDPVEARGGRRRAERRRRRPTTAPRVPVVAAIVNAAQSPPFMTSKRVVVVRDYRAAHRGRSGAARGGARPTRSTRRSSCSSPAAAGRRRPARRAARRAEVVGPGLGEDRRRARGRARARRDLTLGKRRRPGRRRAARRRRRPRRRARRGARAPRSGRASTLERRRTSSRISARRARCRSFELTNAIEDGEVARRARRSCTGCSPSTSARQPKPMHPLQVMACCSRTTASCCGSTTRRSARPRTRHAALGGKGSTYPAQKALEASQRSGTDGLRERDRLAAPGRPRPQGRERDARERP